MSYTDLDYVKLKLNTASSSYDTYLGTIITNVDEIINQMLRDYADSVPVPDTAEDYKVIQEGAALMVAGTFRHEREEPNPERGRGAMSWGKSLKEEGIKLIESYIKQHYTTKSGKADMLRHNRSNPSWGEP